MVDRNKSKRGIIRLVITIFIIISAILNILKQEDILIQSIQKKSIQKLNKASFYFENNKDEKKEIKLPFKIKTNEVFYIDFDISDINDLKEKSLGSNIGFLDFSVLLDGDMIYAYKTMENSPMVKGAGYNYFIVDISKNSDVLTIKYIPKVSKSRVYYIRDVSIATREEFIDKSLFGLDNIIIMLIVSIQVILGILMICIFLSFKHKKVQMKDFLYACIISLIVSIYTITLRDTVLFIFSQRRQFVYFINLVCIMFILLPYIFLIRDRLDEKFSKYLNICVHLMFLNYLIQSILTFLKISDFIDMLHFTHIVLFISLFVILVSVFKTDSNKYPLKKEILVYFSPALLCMIWAMSLYYFFQDRYYELSVYINILFFLSVNIYFFLIMYKKVKEVNDDTVVYKKILEIDSLSLVGNRYLFEKKAYIIENSKQKKHIISIDMNNLKHINDNFGHNFGDMAIKNTSDFLLNYVNYDDIYRMGGDEFVIVTEKIPNNFVNILRTVSIYVCDISHKMNVSLSVGHSVYDPSYSKSLYDELKISDEKMYEDKKLYKAEKYYERIFNNL